MRRLSLWLLVCALLTVPSGSQNLLERPTWDLLDRVVSAYPDAVAANADRTAVMTLVTSLAYFYPELKRALLAQATEDDSQTLYDKTASRRALQQYLCSVKRSTLGMEALSNCDNYYLPMLAPTAAALAKERPPQKGECSLGEVNEWLQGETTIKSGAMTLLLFISHSCQVCHEVLPKIDRMYRQYKHRGLNVVGIHSSPKGYVSSPQERKGISDFFIREKISFPLADMTFKSGPHPLDDEGYPDYRAAAKTPVLKSSIYHALFGGLEFATPLAFIVKNCQPLLEAPVDSYNILALDASVDRAADAMLWPEDLEAEFVDTYEAEGGGADFVLPGERAGEEEEAEGETHKVEKEDEDEEEEEREEARRRRRRRRRSEL